MIIMIIYATISFLFDGLFSNFMDVGIINPSIFRTIFSVIAISIMFNYFDNYKKYYYILLVMGSLFDIVYTNTFLLNIFLFFIIFFILEKLNYFVPNNLFTINIKSLLAIFLYHSLSYLILMMANYEYYSINLLWTILTHSIISTVIYASISYLIIKRVFFKKYDKKIK